MLRDVGGWWVGCDAELENVAAVRHAVDLGWIRKRVHYAPAVPEGVESWELSDLGLHYLGEISGPESKERAERSRDQRRRRQREWLAAHPDAPHHPAVDAFNSTRRG